MKSEKYIGKTGARQGAKFENFDHIGYTTIKVLPKLHGKVWDDVALGYLHSLRPSHIRVIKPHEGVQLDAQSWRVNVYIDDNNIITGVDQEVEVGLPDGVANGEAMGWAVKKGIDSPQVQWYNTPNISHYQAGIGGYCIIQNDGTRVDFPKD